MFIIFPWRVDVPQERCPFVNWLIIAVTIGVFVIQVRDFVRYEPDPPAVSRDELRDQIANGDALKPPDSAPTIPGITGRLMLNGWGLEGLFGYMWLHGGIAHLIGNMWFLWLFGNAVCAKIGNLRYLLLYVFLGVAAGVTHLVFSSGTAVGASGAINGVVGMYLVLFFENEITCYFFFWLIFFFLRQFSVGSCWMILFWLFWDVFGAFVWSGDSNVAYFAHLGGFGAGFGIALAMCKVGWITMERYERSLLQWWQDWRHGPELTPFDVPYGRLERELAEVQVSGEPAKPAAPAKPKPTSSFSVEDGNVRPPPDGLIHVACSCGRTIKASPQYEGKVVRCPHCKGAVRIARADGSGPACVKTSGPDGYVRFACPCGKRMKVPARYAGRRGKCPQCGATVEIPRVS